MVCTVEVRTAGMDQPILLTQSSTLGPVLRAVAGVLHLNAVDDALFGKLTHQRHALVNGRVCKYQHRTGSFRRGDHFLHRGIFYLMQHHAARLPAKEITVQLAVHSIAQPQLVQRFHNAAFEQHTAVLCVFQRLFRAELRVQRFDLLCALQAALVAALSQDVAVLLQFPAFRVREVAQQVHAMLMLMVIAGQLGGRKQAHAVLHRVLIAVVYAEQGVVVGNGHGVQPRPRRHERQAVDGHRAIGTGGMVVKIAGHGK